MYNKTMGSYDEIPDGMKHYINNYGCHFNKLYDACYVACMCVSDYFGKSVPDEKHMAMFIRDMIDDPDATEGFIFNRFIADCMFMNNPVEWEDCI